MHHENINDYLPRLKSSERSELLNADMTDPGASHSLPCMQRKEKPLTTHLGSLLCQILFGQDGCLHLVI